VGTVTQLARVFLGEPIYELRRPLTTDDRSFIAELHIGVSAQVVRGELLSPIKTSLVIGIIAIALAFMVAISSANLLIKPLKAISTSIDHLEHGSVSAVGDARLRRDETVTGVTNRLRQLGERLAGERTELELMRGRLRQVISHLEERLLLINREGRVILAGDYRI
jgi:signal transduction histidine kinase